MADVKVITVTAGEEFLKALAKLLGSDVAAAAGIPAAPAEPKPTEDEGSPEHDEEYDNDDECPCEECKEDDEEYFDFGQILNSEDEEQDEFFKRVYKVKSAESLNVTVTPQGVVTKGVSEEEFDSFSDTFAPNGAYDEVTAYFDSDDETLEVVLWKVGEDGKEVEIEGW